MLYVVKINPTDESSHVLFVTVEFRLNVHQRWQSSKVHGFITNGKKHSFGRIVSLSGAVAVDEREKCRQERRRKGMIIQQDEKKIVWGKYSFGSIWRVNDRFQLGAKSANDLPDLCDRPSRCRRNENHFYIQFSLCLVHRPVIRERHVTNESIDFHETLARS